MHGHRDHARETATGKESLTGIGKPACSAFPEELPRSQGFMAALCCPSCLNCNFLCAAPGPLCEAQPSQGCRDRREVDVPRSSCPAATSPNPLSSFTSSDFLRGPVAQVFGQHFAHVAVLWKQLDHLQASGSCWKGSTEQQDKEQQQMSGHTRFTLHKELDRIFQIWDF